MFPKTNLNGQKTEIQPPTRRKVLKCGPVEPRRRFPLLAWNKGQILKRTYGTVTYRARKIGTYSQNDVPNAWLRQSE